MVNQIRLAKKTAQLSRIARYAPFSQPRIASLGAIARYAIISWLAVCAWCGVAAAQSNVHEFSCAQGFSGSVCKAGNPGQLPCTGSEGNNVDLLDITGVATGSVITFSFSHTGTSPNTTINVAGQGNTGNPTPSTVTVPPNPQTMSYTVTATDAADGQSDFQVQVTTNPAGNLKAAASYTVACTPGRGSITITKSTVGGNGTFGFTGSGPTPISNFSLTTPGSPTTTLTNLTAGTYTITENDPTGAGFNLTNLTCTDPTNNTTTNLGTRTATINLAAGENVSCTYTNTKQSSITITKSTVGGNGTFGFTGTGPTSISPFNLTTPGSPTTTLTGLTPGNYTITEDDPTGTGFNLTNLTCTDPTNNTTTNLGTRTATINLAAGENVTCTYSNSKQSSITIVKNTTGGDGTFGFTSTIPGQASFNLTTVNGTISTTFSNVTPGSYTVTESASAGFNLTNLQCTGDTGGTATTVNLANRTATIGLDTGESITCTYTNAKQGSITITKNTTGGDGTFGFTSTIPGQASFNLTTSGGTASTTFSNVTPGSYTVTEATFAGFTFTNLQCTGDNNGSVDQGSRTATINLDAGENITCTYTNTKNGSLKVKKVTIGGDDKFSFAVTGQSPFVLMNGQEKLFPSLTAGQYTIEETNLPQGWTLQNATCGQGNKQGNAVTVTLDPGENIVCTFTNFKQKDDKMEDVTELFIHRRVDNLLTHGPDRARLLRRLQEQQEPGLKDHDPLKLGGNADGEAVDVKFSTSLSQVRAAALAAEAKKIQEYSPGAALLGGQPVPNLVPSMRHGVDFWVEGHITRYQDDTGGIKREGDFSILYFGVDAPLTQNVLVGTLVQLDRTDEKVKDPALVGTVEGTGWMIGPYVGVKLLNNLFFDARIAWGQSDNDITLTDPLTGTRSGSFDTTRWLATATLTGNHLHGPWRITPSIGVAYGNEKHSAFQNTLGQTVDGHDISIGRLTAGTEVGYRLLLGNGTVVEPHLALIGIWNFASDDLIIDGAEVETNKSRAKVEGGVIVRTPSGWSVRAAGAYDGIGHKDLEAYSGQLWINVPLE